MARREDPAGEDHPPHFVPDLVLPEGELWVFGYGSLMWKPGFAHAEMHLARIHGYHRALCVWSWHYRGTRRRPGLVLGLDRGGCCSGRAFRVPPRERSPVLDYLYRRELISRVYIPVLRTVRLADGRRVRALTFRVDRSHVQYAGRLDPLEAAEVVRRARGRMGPNREYVANTVAHLAELGMRCGQLEDIHRLLSRD